MLKYDKIDLDKTNELRKCFVIIGIIKIKTLVMAHLLVMAVII